MGLQGVRFSQVSDAVDWLPTVPAARQGGFIRAGGHDDPSHRTLSAVEQPRRATMSFYMVEGLQMPFDEA